MRRSVLGALTLWLCGCFSPGGFSDEMPDDFPAAQCEDTDTEACVSSTGDDVVSSSGPAASSSSTGTDPTDQCDGSDTCLGDGACVATWDAATTSRGPFECRFACVPLLDEAAWCSDDASCCDVGATCTARGYCVLEGEGSSSGTTGS